MSTPPWPTRISYSRSSRILLVTFDDGSCFDLPAELLRVESPSAEVQGHGGQGKTLVTGKTDVEISHIEPVGRYAVRLIFSDGHDSGLYSWQTLYRFGQERNALIHAYQQQVGR